LKDFFKEYFSFSKSERNGVLVLLGILLIISLLPRVSGLFVKKPLPDFSQFEKDIASFQKNQKEMVKYPENKPKENFNFTHPEESVVKNKLNPFYFNPNNLPEAKWKELGLSDKQIKTIKNYEAKGGKFYKPEDFKKMYCISENEYTILAPYIVIPETRTENKPDVNGNTKFPVKDDNIIVDINLADTTEFMKIRGIGSSFANRIIKYRDRLGGFVKKEQIKEVYGMDSIKYNSIAANLKAGPFIVQKININDVGVEDLKKHPYIDFYVAQAIVNYRGKHGKYAKVEDIKKTALVYDALFNKISPYLTVK
jgi:competence protein ComEA